MKAKSPYQLGAQAFFNRASLRAAMVGLCGGMLVANAAMAETISGSFTVKTVFSENDSTAGFTVAQGLPGCLYQIMYIDLSTNGSRARLALLMSAKSAGWKVSRIDYTIYSNGSCWARGVHVE